ncbi:MAG TPA: protein kinase, partial [Polyangiaceae bacterium]
MSGTPFPGMLVGSNVHLERQLGSGGQGSIWVANHLGLQIRVAVKFLAPDLASQAEARARFEREAAAAAQLKNPHVVQVFDRGVTEQGLPYIVMELLTGEDLNRRIERLGPRPVLEVAAIIAQVARALSSAHAQGIVHRDIKPENVFLIATDGEIFVKLLDFGIAKRAEDKALSMTSANIMLGTPYFMSPEQVTSTKDVDFRTDLWSVGVVAYTALTAKLPFEGSTLGAVCIAINSGVFEPVSVRQPQLPAALDVWFERAFQLDPAKRFASMHEMATAFEVAVGVSSARALAHAAPGAPAALSSDRSSPALFRVPTENRFDSVLTRPTFAGASITQGEQPPQNQLLMALGVVLISAVSSALTTVLFLAPASFDGVTRVFTGSPPPPATTSLAPQPSTAADLIPDAASDPSDPSVAAPASSAPEIQANTPEKA